MSNIIEEEIIPTFKMFPRNGVDNIFKIYAAVPKDTSNTELLLNEKYNIIIKGRMQNLELERVYKARLEGVDDPKYGFGYQVHSIFEDIPTTKDAQHNFLNSMMTDLQLGEIYKVYPDQDIIELFKTDNFDFKKVKGLGLITYEKIKKRIMENLEWQSLFSELGKYGVKFETMKKLIDLYGTAEAAIEKVKENPYVLTELHGIGFKKADVIAKNMGIPDTSPFRIHSGIKHAVSEEENSGHTYIERKNLIVKCMELLVIDEKYIVQQINEVEGLYIEDDKIALYKTYRAEEETAYMLVNRLMNSNKLSIDLDKFLNEQEKEYGFKLTTQQRNFFSDFVNYNIVFLVGNAGVGKSFLQKILINLIKKMNIGDVEIITSSYKEENSKNNCPKSSSSNMTYKLLAPTGRAAKVLSQYVEDTEASTIHRAIGFGKREDDSDGEGQTELKEDVILGDEMSMAEIKLINALLKKTSNPKARIVFIGDDFQIASVGCGNFLKDCLDSGIFPVTKLDKVFRQEEGGGLDIATKVRQGIKFIDDDFIGEKKYGKDAIIRSVDQIHMEKGYQYYYKMFLKMYSPEDIMVLSSTKKGSLGTIAINKYIQSIVNPATDGLKEIKYHDDCTFRVNDYIMNTKNTYEIRDIDGNVVDIVNGDSGTIIDIVREEELEDTNFKEKLSFDFDEDQDDFEQIDSKEYKVGIYVKFDVGIVAIPFERMDQLMHSWALTKHKAQGGSAKAVISIADKSQKFQLNANLIYTGLTRFKEKLVILCQADTLNYALKKFENKSRRTFLEGLLRTKHREYNSK
ncbi:hypothetical protein BSK59_13065 [Paenibacillus odorifer]|uniref:ATP-dependent DNA helicase n=1 Tax=Paenibacillus odorifer TaxID=189426 RepID=UPI00096BFDAA|nr:ATP-dependent RecD-like DNA helicase [Paenibacillus odorifer]OME55403.1 hypothetical protein BSK59_13065 [Paenibacillus odorifer]